jgi:glutamate-1-semialdehyde 2,1-aminomutase
MTYTPAEFDSLRHGLLPGGVGRGSLNISLDDGRVPYAVAASGYTLRDELGTELIDINNNMTVNLHGHAHPAIVQAVQDRFAEGMISLGIGNAFELELTGLLLDRVTWADRVRFANSGTEAVMTAVRIARAATGRSKILAFSPGYHGLGDSLLPAMGDYGLRGLSEGTAADTLRIPPGDLDALEAAFASHGEEIAAFVVDLCAVRTGFTPMTPEFVARARELTSSAGALLIVDEVVNFRNAYHGQHTLYGLTPDLLTLGKIIGGGFPVGAVLGGAETMRMLDPGDPAHIEHGGTFTANPITMSAGAAAMRMFDEAAVARLNGLCERLESNVAEAARTAGWAFCRNGSAFRLLAADAAADDRPGLQHALYRTSYARGLLASASGLCALSTVMDEAVIDAVSERLIEAALATPAR